MRNPLLRHRAVGIMGKTTAELQLCRSNERVGGFEREIQQSIVKREKYDITEKSTQGMTEEKRSFYQDLGTKAKKGVEKMLIINIIIAIAGFMLVLVGSSGILGLYGVMPGFMGGLMMLMSTITMIGTVFKERLTPYFEPLKKTKKYQVLLPL